MGNVWRSGVCQATAKSFLRGIKGDGVCSLFSVAPPHSLSCQWSERSLCSRFTAPQPASFTPKTHVVQKWPPKAFFHAHVASMQFVTFLQHRVSLRQDATLVNLLHWSFPDCACWLHWTSSPWSWTNGSDSKFKMTADLLFDVQLLLRSKKLIVQLWDPCKLKAASSWRQSLPVGPGALLFATSGEWRDPSLENEAFGRETSRNTNVWQQKWM